MADPNVNDTARPDLELQVGSETPVELRQLASVSDVFANLINDVAEAFTGHRKPVNWTVEVQEGSVRLPLKAEPSTENVRPSAMPEIASAIAHGMAQLEQEPVRPDYFTDQGLEYAKALAGLLSDELPLSVRNGGERIALSKQLLVNVDIILGQARLSFGSVEGRLEALNIHGAKKFSIYSSIDGKAVTCNFGRHLELDDVLHAVGKNVMVRGAVKTTPRGERSSIEAHSIRVLGSRVVTADEVFGILEGSTEVGW